MNFLNRIFSSKNYDEKINNLEKDVLRLENCITKKEVEIETIKSSLKEAQISLNLTLNSYQTLVEEINSLYEAINSAGSTDDSKLFSFRDFGSDDDDSGNYH